MTPSLDKPLPIALMADDGAPAQTLIPPGKAVVFNFWSPSCGPCKNTISAVQKKEADIENKGAVHVLVLVQNKGETLNDAKAALALWGIKGRFLVDTDGAFFAKVGARDVPAFAITDAAGVLRWVAPDGITISNILDAIP